MTIPVISSRLFQKAFRNSKIKYIEMAELPLNNFKYTYKSFQLLCLPCDNIIIKAFTIKRLIQWNQNIFSFPNHLTQIYTLITRSAPHFKILASFFTFPNRILWKCKFFPDTEKATSEGRRFSRGV